MSGPSFSVITVTYNLVAGGRAETFRQAVRSVCDQTYDKVEHIVIDGGSQDGSRELIEDLHKAGKITRYISEPDGGIYEAMNKGAALATGDYILYLNSDDYYHDREGLAHAAAAIKNTGADFCYGPLRQVTVVDEETGVSRPKPNKVYAGMPFGHPTLATRRTRFNALGGFDTDFRIVADYDFILRHFLIGGTGTALPAGFATFRHGGISADTEAVAAEMALSWQKNFSAFDPKGKVDWADAVRRKRAPAWLFWNMLRSRDLGPVAKRLAFHELVRSSRKSLQYLGRNK